MIHLRTPGGDKDMYCRGILTPGGLRDIATVRLTTPGGSITVFDRSTSLGALTVTPSSPVVSGAIASPASVSITTAYVNIAVTGGTAPYTYSWSSVAGWSLSGPTSATTNFASPPVASGADTTATFTCTVTDARGATGTASVDAEVSNYGRF